MNPSELMNYMEIVSGSIKHKKKFLTSQKSLEKLENEILEQNEAIRNLKKNRRNALFMIQSNNKAKEMITQNDELYDKIFKLKIFQFIKELIKHQKSYSNSTEDLQLFYQKIDDASKQISDLKKSNFKTEKQNLQKDFQNSMQNNLQIQKKINDLERIISELKSDNEIHEKDIKMIYTPQLNYQKNKKEQLEAKQNEYEKRKQQIIDSMQNKNNMKLNKKDQKQIEELGELFQKLRNAQKNEENMLSSIDKITQNLLTINSHSNKQQITNDDKQEKILEKQNLLMDLQNELKQLNSQKINLNKQIELNEKNQEKINQIQKQIDEIEQGIIINQQNNYSANQNIELQNSLKKSVPGFLGELSQMINPLERKFSLSIAMSLSPILEYLVVDNMNSALQIGKILKAREIFKSLIVLENAPQMNQKELANKRVNLKNNQYLCYDLIHFKNDSQRFHDYIVHYLRDTFICEDTKQGMDLMKNNNASKIVTLDGVVLMEKGVEQYGSQYYMPMKIKKFLQKEDDSNKKQDQEDLIFNLKQTKQELMQKINKSSAKEMIQLEQNISNLQSKIDQANQFVNQNKAVSKQLKEENEKNLSILHQKEDEYNQMRQQLGKIQEEKQNIQNHFQDLKNQIKKQFNINDESIMSLIMNKNDIENDLIQIENNLKEIQFQHQQCNIDQYEEQIVNIQKTIQHKLNEIEEIKQKIEQINFKNQNFKKDEEKFKQKMEEINQQEESINEKIQSLRQSINQFNNKIDSLKKQQSNFYQTFQEQKLNLFNYISEEQYKGKTIDIQLKESIDQISTQNDFENSQLETNDILKYINIDNVRELNEDQFQELLNNYQKQYEISKNKISQFTINLINEDFLKKEEQRMDNIKDELNEQKQKVANLIEQEKQLKQELQKIVQERNQCLKNFLDPIIMQINNVYKFVNCDINAQANFIIENPFQYFSKGLIFSAVPPNKSYTIGTESLSSGESSLANLTLFLAINEQLKSPFIILDEIDANLDSNNIYKLISSFGKFSQNKQVIFISHKPFVYKHAEILFGITKNNKTNSAVCFSLNLQKYRNNQFYSQIKLSN